MTECNLPFWDMVLRAVVTVGIVYALLGFWAMIVSAWRERKGDYE
jgi:hypothetical protein